MADRSLGARIERLKAKLAHEEKRQFEWAQKADVTRGRLERLLEDVRKVQAG